MRERKTIGGKKRKRVIRSKSYKEWKKYICKCLERFNNEKRNPRWGCLNKQGKLFEIKTLMHKHVPKDVVQKMVKKGIIKYNEESGFYDLIPKHKRKKK